MHCFSFPNINANILKHNLICHLDQECCNILEVSHPGAGVIVCGARCGSWTLDFLGRISAIAVMVPFVGHPLGSKGLDYSMSSLEYSFPFVVQELFC